ncbi:hypothetical protein F4678DRAFT_426836 [Xylaria arbuscula]|nr:hypothetical protein F4678DRAFT_426836 [Xylaria arbuscula]
MISTLCLAISCLFLLMRPQYLNCPGSSGSYARGFSTEIANALLGTHLKDTRFRGALTYNETGSLVIDREPGESVWIGKPSTEMDELWNSLERANIIHLQGDEAKLVREDTAFLDGRWITGVDVFHQLHCLNMVRKGLYPEHYRSHQSERNNRIHIEHCFDYIRQALMCHADLTPVKTRWEPNAGIFGPAFDTVHKCRDFGQILEWSLARGPDSVTGVGTEVLRNQDLAITEERHFYHGHGR